MSADGQVSTTVQEELNPSCENNTMKNQKKEFMPRAQVDGDMPEDGSAAGNKAPDIGTSCTVVKLWEGRSSKNKLVWLTEPPEVEAEDDSISESPQHAITLLHRGPKEKGKQRLDTIVMRGKELRKFLDDTIPNISSFYNEAEHGIAVRLPFRLLFWHLEHIDAAAKGDDEKLSKVTTLLRDVLEDEFRDLFAKRAELVAQEQTNFDTLWTLFRPGTTCLTSHANSVVATKVSSVEYSRSPQGSFYYQIRYSFLAWNGEHIGWEDSSSEVFEFTGRRNITDLDIFPIAFHSDPSLADQLAARGRRFVGLAIREPYMMSFDGELLDRESSPMWWQGEQRRKVSS